VLRFQHNMAAAPIYLNPQFVKVAEALPPSVPLTIGNFFKHLPENVKPLAGGAAAAGAGAMLVPWKTLGATRDYMAGDSRKNEMPQAMTTDAGRAIGSALGMGAAKGLAETMHVPTGSPLLRAALMGGGIGLGGLLGHMRGNSVGQDLFPGSLRDRLQKAVHNF